MNITNTNYPAAFTIRSAWIDAGYTKTESLLYTDMDPPSHYGIDGALLRGVTFTYLNDSYKTNMENLIYYMALGTDYDLDMNIAKITADIPSGVVFDLTGSSSTAAQIKGRISQVGLSNARLGAIGASKKTGTSIASTLSFPHWPTGKLRQQSANLFKYNKNPLKIGQGLPLLIESQVNGYVQVSFNYTVKYGLDDSTKANSIKLDICGEDFLNTTHTYFNGYEGLVDPSSTTKTLKQLKTLSNTTGKVELTIPIKKDQSLWFRMTPTVETGGYYASMSNLKIESYSE